MDLMIHDLDLVLSLVKSEITHISASGIAVVGGHEDLAEARIEFASGCIASLRVSRLAAQATRRMQVFASDGYANIDFSASEVQIVKPSEQILHREISLDRMNATERIHYTVICYPLRQLPRLRATRFLMNRMILR
jgi:predicted dehydrogenase